MEQPFQQCNWSVIVLAGISTSTIAELAYLLVCWQVRTLIARLRAQWLGADYELLTNNCLHFCDELAESLGVPKIPGASLQAGSPGSNPGQGRDLLHNPYISALQALSALPARACQYQKHW